MKQIFAQLFYELEKHNDAVLVSLIDDNGSAPRGAGSQMLITDFGRRCGTIGGGAVEKRSEEMAMELIEKRQSLVHTFRLHTNQTEDIGMVCGGDVTVHFQFIAKDDPAWHAAAAAVLSLYEKKECGHLVLFEDGSAPTVCDSHGNPLCGGAVESAMLAKGCKRMNGLFSMPVSVGNRAILFGAGHIAQSLCPILASVDFRVTVFDSREEFAKKDLFPTAEHIICGDYEKISEYIMKELGRGVTLYDVTGAYTNEKRIKLSCICSPAQSAIIRRYLAEHSPNSFVEVSRVLSVYAPDGKRFVSLQEN